MATPISNLMELQSAYIGLLSEALENTMNEALWQLDKIIDDEVYGWSVPWEENRTYQFKESWETERVKLVGSFIESGISQTMSIMQQFLLDGVEVHEDRENLAEIIESGDGYNFGTMKEVPRPFWSEFMKWCDLNLENEFIRQCRLLGLNISTSYNSFSY